MKVYDFDKTIYDGDSTIDFYLFCLKRNKWLIILLPIQIWGMLLYILKIKEKEYFKEKYFIFLKKLRNVDNLVNEFWDKNEHKVKTWYIKQHRVNDVIISASPQFLLDEIAKRIKIKIVIATKIDKKTGNFLSKNCYGNEKVRCFKEIFGSRKEFEFYTDSISDMPMINIAKKAYLVNGERIEELK